MHNYPTLLHILTKTEVILSCRWPPEDHLKMPRVFPIREMRESPPHLLKTCSFPTPGKNFSSVDSPHQRFLLQWSESLLLRFLPPNKNGGKSLHPLTLFGKPWCYCVGMSWDTAPSISHWLPLYLLHQVLLPTLTLSLLEKLKNSIFEMPIIPQTLNINNSTTTRTKSINPHTIRELIEYSLKKGSNKGNVFSYHFRDIDVRR